MSKREISVTITFTEDNLQSILDGVWWTNEEDEIEESPQLEELTVAQFGQLVDLMQESAPEFRDELMAGMDDAVANGWLDDFIDELREPA